jgi:hypothetical protein
MLNLLEAFDNPLQYVRNREDEKIYKKVFYSSGIRYFEIYSAKLGTDEINFYLFLNSNRQYEIHFSNSANDHEIVPLDRYKNNQLTRIIATGLHIATGKLQEKTTPFLIYGDTKRKTDLYVKAIKSKIPDVVTSVIEPVQGIDGYTYPYGVVIYKDTRTFKIENLLRLYK